jgi:hypothetical protein
LGGDGRLPLSPREVNSQRGRRGPANLAAGQGSAFAARRRPTPRFRSRSPGTHQQSSCDNRHRLVQRHQPPKETRRLGSTAASTNPSLRSVFVSAP